MSNEMHWYAFKVFCRKVCELRAGLASAGLETYYPVQSDGRPYVHSLLFVRCCEHQLLELRRDASIGNCFSIYTHTRKRKRLDSDQMYECQVPAPIDDNEMAVFILVTSASPDTYTILGPDDPKYHTGQQVRVVAGPFEGLVGRVRRIKKDRRLVITITGVVAVATVHIDPRLLEPVEENYGAPMCADDIFRNCRFALG